MGVQLCGFYQPLSVIPPERLEGAEIFSAFSSLDRHLELKERDLTAHVGSQSYPRLRLRSARQLDYCGRKYLRLEFGRGGAPWLKPLTFCCWADGHLEAGVGGHDIVEAVTIGYPQYSAEWVVKQIAC